MKSPEEFAKYLNDYLPDRVLPEQIANRDEQIREEQREECWKAFEVMRTTICKALLNAGKEKSDEKS